MLRSVSLPGDVFTNNAIALAVNKKRRCFCPLGFQTIDETVITLSRQARDKHNENTCASTKATKQTQPFVQVELPATLAGIWLLDCAGRKKTTLALFLLLGPDAHACLSVGATIYATWLSSSSSCFSS